MKISKQPKYALIREIGAVFLLKIILLSILWYVCFSKPLDNHNTQYMSKQAAAHFLSSTHEREAVTHV